MTTTAGVMVPGRRHAFNAKLQASSKDKDNRNRKLKRARLKSSSTKSSDEDNIHKTWGKSKDYAYVFTGSGEEKPWSKLENHSKRKFRSYKAKPPPVEENHHIYKIKEDGKRKVRKGTLVVSDKYFEAVKDERTRLLELLDSLQKRNDVLERENANIVQDFETLNRENAMLRKKLDTDGEPVVESYRRVFDDRKLLREAENSYKSRIGKLEEELRVTRRNHQRLADELKVQKFRTNKKSDELEMKGKYNRYYWDCYHLRAENEFLKSSVKSLREKLDTTLYVHQKSPSTAPPKMIKLPDVIPKAQSPVVEATEVYGHRVHYLTLPEIERRREADRQQGAN